MRHILRHRHHQKEPNLSRVDTSTDYQARADAAEIEARNAVTPGVKARHDEARRNWQRLADQARESELARALRAENGIPSEGADGEKERITVVVL